MGAATALDDLLRRGALGGPAGGDARHPTGEIERQQGRALPTGLPELDRLLGGGLPAGRLSELRGARGGGTARVGRPRRGSPRSGGSWRWWMRPRRSIPARRRARGSTCGASSGSAPRGPARRPAPWTPSYAAAASPSPSSTSARPPRWLRRAGCASPTPPRRAGPSLLSLGATGADFCATLSLELRRLRADYQGRGPGRTLEGFRARIEVARNKLGLRPGVGLEIGWQLPELLR